MKSDHPKCAGGDAGHLLDSAARTTARECRKAMQERRTRRLFAELSDRLRGPGSQEINTGLLQAQAEALGQPLLQRDFKKLFRDFTSYGADMKGAAFGHIKIYRDLVERICKIWELSWK